MSKEYYIIPIFVPHLGCPHNCVFCNQKKITGLSTDMTPEIADSIIQAHLRTIPDSCKELEIAFYGGSFTGIEMNLQKKLLGVANNYKKQGMVHKIRLSTRPDYIDEDILSTLKENGVDIIELGVQSLDEDVLKLSGRGHTREDVFKASELIKKFKTELGLQMMIGLPGDTREKSINTAQNIIDLNPSCVRIYPTLVVRDTYLEKMFLEGLYTPLTLEEAVDISTDLLMQFEQNNINVIRIGLQPTENIALGKDVVAGPFHPSFRQLVESNVYKIILEDYLDGLDKNLFVNNDLIIEINQKEISNISGQNSKNIKFLKSKEGIKTLKIHKADISRDVFYIKNNNYCGKINKREVIKEHLEKK